MAGEASEGQKGGSKQGSLARKCELIMQRLGDQVPLLYRLAISCGAPQKIASLR
jgi:hypothetical protein